MGSIRQERCKTFLLCLANSHDDRVVFVLKQSLKKKYSYIVDAFYENTNKFEKCKKDVQMLEKVDDSTIQKPFTYIPTTDLSFRPTTKQRMEGNQDEIDGVKPFLITDGRRQLKVQHATGANRKNRTFLNILVSTDSDEEDIIPKSCIKKPVSSALEMVTRTSNPKYITLELFTVKARIYIMRKKMKKLQEIIDDAKMIIEADPVGCTGRAVGWLYLNESRGIMIQTGILNFGKKRSYDTYSWLHEKAKVSLMKELTNFQEDGGKDGPFGFGYAQCLLVILLLRCGENGLTMGVLTPPEEDVKQAGDLLQQFENSEILISKILEEDYYVAKSDYQY
ncbi:hypothetical protein CHS0354_038776 [Potamilus streckersoni]|uniref:Uncharacterized protein n=1 Tax=Potamilus streckersoni TaxID=2493646 RepID=A0AAE0W1F4_9BIVA|nr:hypothetical protein CHS0354_038776 [Potamilus streckersoni]